MQVEVDREKAGRLGVSMQAINDTLNDAFGQRQISTIYAQANQYRVILEAQPRYQQDPSALSKLYVTGSNTSTGTTATVGNTAAGSTNTNTLGDAQHRHRLKPGAALDLRALRAHLGAARDRAPGAVSLGDDQLQSGARLGAERRGRRDHRGAAHHRHADVGDRHLFRRRRRVRQVAGRPAVADPGRRDHDLHRARRAVRELHPSAHDPVDAAVGRRRRAARADAVRLRPVGDRADRHRAADGHRQEERDHDDRLRARGRARAGPVAARRRSCRRRCCASARS